MEKLINNKEITICGSGQSLSYLNKYTNIGIFCNSAIKCNQINKFGYKIWFIGRILVEAWNNWYEILNNLNDINCIPNTIIVLVDNSNIANDKFAEFKTFLNKNYPDIVLLKKIVHNLGNKKEIKSTGVLSLEYFLELKPKKIIICGFDGINNDTSYNSECFYDNKNDSGKKHLICDIKFFEKNIDSKILSPIKECGLYKWIDNQKNNYLKWADNELNKIPLLKIENKWTIRNATLGYICDQLDKNNDQALEFGVYKGSTLKKISKHVKKGYGFDGFQGLPKGNIGWKAGGLEVNHIPNCGNNIELVVGWYEETLDDFLKNNNSNFKLIHIDCDVFSSTKYVLNLLHKYNRLKKGTIIVFDEILNYPYFLEGELKALYEIAIEKKINFKWIGTHGKVMKSSELNSDKFNKLKLMKQFRSIGYFQEAAIEII